MLQRLDEAIAKKKSELSTITWYKVAFYNIVFYNIVFYNVVK